MTWNLILRTCLLLFFGAIVLGCQGNTASTSPGVKVVADTSVGATVREYVATAWCGEGLSGAALFQAVNIYRYENCNEIQETLEVVKVRDEESTSAAFIRYSVGTKVFREVMWFQNIGERYARTFDPYSKITLSTALNEEIDEWEKGSATWYE